MLYIEPTLGNLISCLWRHAFLVIVGTLAAMAIAVAAYLATTPMYRAHTSLLIGSAQHVDSMQGSPIPTEIMNSQAQIAGSVEVVRAAIETIGLASVPEHPPGPLSGLGGKLRSLVKEKMAGEAEKADPKAVESISPMDLAIPQFSRRLTVETEPNSNVLTISYTGPDPVQAAKFANAMAVSFIDRQNELLERPGVVDFFRDQTTRFDDEVARRSENFLNFVEREGIYSINEQRSLLLQRLSALEGALSATRSELKGKEGEKEAMARQLALLQPVARSPFALNFVQTLGRDAAGETDPVATEGISLDSDDTPPLLMIKVFQEVMSEFRVGDSRISGLRAQAAQQESEIKTIILELSRLAAKQSEYERLDRELNLATFNADTFAKRTVEEQIDSDLLEARLSNVRVIQPATVPLQAASPRGMLYMGSGIAFGLLLGTALAFAKEAYDLSRKARRTRGGTPSP
jgi:uncharacterized protein involved in exopolysaccharide biosynthesis